MTIETEVAALTAATTQLVTNVGVQQAGINATVASFASVIGAVEGGLNNVNNTSDADKPISLASAAALAGKQSTLESGTSLATVNGVNLLEGGNVVVPRGPTTLNAIAYDDRATLRTLASPQPDDSNVVQGLGLFMFVGSTLEPDDDETCFTNGTGQWLLSVPSFDLTSAYDLVESEIQVEQFEDEVSRLSAFFATL